VDKIRLAPAELGKAPPEPATPTLTDACYWRDGLRCRGLADGEPRVEPSMRTDWATPGTQQGGGW